MTVAINKTQQYAQFPDGIKRRILYDHGLPFSKGLNNNLEALQDRITLKKASLAIVDGGVGEGKTTIAIHMAEYFQKSPLDLKLQLAMGGEEFQEKLQMCIDSKKKVLVYDEAGDFNKRGSLTAFNQRLNRVFETYRGYRILIILALPNFGVLDQQLFDNRIPRLLLHCYNRNNKFGNYKAYSLFRMFYLRHKMKKIIVPPHAYGQTEPNFYGHFLDLHPNRSTELEKITLEGKRDVLNENILANKGLSHTVEIARKLHVSRSWVNKKLKKKQIKPRYTYKRKNYYDNSLIEKLKQEQKNK